MPVDFLSADQQQRYGRFTGDPSADQLARYFHLDEADRAFVRGHVGYALQLGTMRFLGTFLNDPADAPASVVGYVAYQLGVREPLAPLNAYRQSQTRWIHAREIRRRYGYTEFAGAEVFHLTRWLYARAWGSATRPTVLFDLATARLVERKVLLPGVTTLVRLVARVRDRVTARLWQRLSILPDREQRSRLEALLDVDPAGRQTELDRLRRSPTLVSPTGLVSALNRLRRVRDLGVGKHDISRIHPGRLAALSRFAATARARAISRIPRTGGSRPCSPSHRPSRYAPATMCSTCCSSCCVGPAQRPSVGSRARGFGRCTISTQPPQARRRLPSVSRCQHAADAGRDLRDVLP